MTFTSSQAAERLGVTVKTLQRWDRDGLLKPSFRTKTNRRVYTEADLDAFQEFEPNQTKEQREEALRLWKDTHKINLDYQPRYKFNRAVLVLDKGQEPLKAALEKKRFTVLTRKDESDEELMESTIVHRILVTSRYKKYYEAAPVKEFSLIDIGRFDKDPEKIAGRISNAFLDHELTQKQPFYLQLKVDGTVFLHLID